MWKRLLIAVILAMAMDISDEHIRYAAEALLRASSNIQNIQSPDTDISHSHSLTTVPSIQAEYVVSEDLLAGQVIQGRMSSVRRFFCLFVTFDLAFTGLMWLICIMITGQNISTAVDKQIYHYNIHSSLFDVVLAAICRFLVLLLFYGILSINHWFIIALSTTATCAFLIVKVFQYDWVDSHQPVFEVLLILVSFVISWGEAWFLDFRVLPQELHARRFYVNPENERAPLLRNYLQGLPSMHTESIGNFYSPLCSPEGSLHGIDHHRHYPPIRLSRQQEYDYKCKGKEILQQSWNYLNNSDWKLEKLNKDNDTVHVCNIQTVGKIFKLTATVNIPPRYLLDELFYNVENIPQWNPSLLESHKVHTINEHTDISYQISAEAAGIISSRDFVNIRHWDVIDDCYVIGFSAIDHPSLQKSDKYVRAENGIGCWAMKPVPGEPDKCQFQWVLNTNLNLNNWIPQAILDTALVNMMLDYVKHLRKYITKLTDNSKLSSASRENV